MVFLASLSVLGGCAGIAPPGPQTSAPREAVSVRSAQHADALLRALLALGIDYRSGGNSPELGFDCSGLVAHVYREAYGIRLPHSARAQADAGTPVSAKELRAGDLLFYDTLGSPFSHVGIYLGEGRFVHAPKPGAKVRIERLETRYWIRRFNGARRIEPPDLRQALDSRTAE